MKSDLHIHTSFSRDSFSSPRNVVKAALEADMDCIAVTDHNTIQGAKETYAAAMDHPLLVVPGIEVSSKNGHILGLNIKKEIPAGLSAEETIKRIKQQGGTVIIPHPFHLWMNFKGLAKVLNLIDGVEIFNARILGGSNKKALEFAHQNGLPFTLGSDAHRTGTVGEAFLETEEAGTWGELWGRIHVQEVEAGSRSASTLEKVFHRSLIEISRTGEIFSFKANPVRFSRRKEAKE